MKSIREWAKLMPQIEERVLAETKDDNVLHLQENLPASESLNGSFIYSQSMLGKHYWRLIHKEVERLESLPGYDHTQPIILTDAFLEEAEKLRV